jgi:hypothetical protein
MFTFTQHAYNKINGDVDLARRVRDAAERPSVSYGVSTGRQVGYGGQRRERHIRDGLVAVVDSDAQKIITFYVNVDETDLRPDQTDEAALAYAAERAEKKAAKRARREHNLAARRASDRAMTAQMKGKIK